MLHQIMAATARHDREEEEETAQNSLFFFLLPKHIYNAVHRAENYLLNVLTMCAVTQHEMSFALD